jgi:hypothetical protein
MDLVTLSYVLRSLNDAYNLLYSIHNKPTLFGQGESFKVAMNLVKKTQTELIDLKSVLSYYSALGVDSYNLWAKCDKMGEAVDAYINIDGAFSVRIWDILEKEQFLEITNKRISFNKVLLGQMQYSETNDEVNLKNYIQKFDECKSRAENYITNKGDKQKLDSLQKELRSMTIITMEIHSYCNEAIKILIDRAN